MIARANRSQSAALFFIAVLCAIIAACSGSTSRPGARSGPWGVSCQASGGESGNPACKAAGFACYGISTTDANAFCTLFGCTKDTDCPDSWWCADVNEDPNVTTDTATVQTLGMTRRICLPRSQCDPCKTDHDCASSLGSGGTEEHCLPDSTGLHPFCASQCTSDANCALDATCAPQWTLCSPANGMTCTGDEDCPPANGTYQHCDGGKCTPECGGAADCGAGQSCQPVGLCTPRAGVCTGDGSFCSPCKSDDDCPTGYCFTAAYSTERFCTAVDTASTCDDQEESPPGCPAVPAGANWKGTMCVITQPGQAECYGVVTIGTSSGSPVNAPGCWTANR